MKTNKRTKDKTEDKKIKPKKLLYFNQEVDDIV